MAMVNDWRSRSRTWLSPLFIAAVFVPCSLQQLDTAAFPLQSFVAKLMTNHVQKELGMNHFVMHSPKAEAAKLHVGVQGDQFDFWSFIIKFD